MIDEITAKLWDVAQAHVPPTIPGYEWCLKAEKGMTVPRAEQEIRRFLASEDPEVLCVSGAWGVGKTFMWDHVLQAARDEGAVALADYSYVSLFGVNSIEDLKQAIFQNRIAVSEVGKEATPASIEHHARSKMKILTDIATNIPGIGGFIGAAAPLLMLTIADQIICIDDLERKGDSLTVRDVFGLVSFLKEQRRCKVVLLSNTSELKGEHRDQYEQNLEKVVDEAFTFEPTAAYCAEIALAGDDTNLAEKCVQLGISNIRVIKRIQRLVRRALAALGDVDAAIRQQTVHTLALVGWITFSKEAAPPLSFVANRISRRMMESVGQRREDEDPREAAWNALIDSYGFTGIDEFDQVLVEGLHKGGFDEEKLRAAARTLKRSVEAQRADEAQRAAWSKFHDSFADDVAEVVETFVSTFDTHMAFVSIVNLCGAMRVLRNVGHDDKAEGLLERYVGIHRGDRSAFDIENGTMFREEVTDEALIRRFNEEFAAVSDDRDPLDLILQIHEQGGSDDDYGRAAAVTVDELVEAFHARSGQELRRLIKACVDSDRVINARATERELSRKAKEALDRIGREHDLNAHRVRKYGVGPLAIKPRDKERDS